MIYLNLAVQCAHPARISPSLHVRYFCVVATSSPVDDADDADDVIDAAPLKRVIDDDETASASANDGAGPPAMGHRSM